MSQSYEFSEYRLFRDHGGLLLPDRTCEFSKNAYAVEWTVRPTRHFHDRADMRLVMRHLVRRLEMLHLTLIFRGHPMLRLDTNQPHREAGVVRKGHHIHWKESSNEKQRTSFDLKPPLNFPDTIQQGEKAEYWKVIDWFCGYSKIDASQVDLSDLEAVKE